MKHGRKLPYWRHLAGSVLWPAVLLFLLTGTVLPSSLPLWRSGKAAPNAPHWWPAGCQRLFNACVDQQQIVMMDAAFQPQAARHKPLPSHNPGRNYNFPWGSDTNPDVWLEEKGTLPAITVRATGSQEPTPDLQHPRFERGILPLLLTPTWQENFGHTLGNSAAFLHSYLRDAPWARRVALVVQTPHGMALPSHWQPLVGPLVPAHPIQTLADFSARLPPAPSNSTAVPRSRCFAEMLLCTGSWEGNAANISQAAQAIVRHYAPSLPLPPVSYISSSGHDCDRSTNSRKTICLRVLFLVRSPKPAVRQILNLPQLLRACRSWEYSDPRSGTRFQAACATYQSAANLTANIAVVRSADVVVGVHGATMANSYFMRPGGALMEVFSSGWTWQVHRMWLDQEARPQLQWWGLTIEDPAAYKPGELEATLLPHPRLYKGPQGEDKRQRDQNLRVPWKGLAQLLQEYAGEQAAGGMAAYLERRAVGRRPVHFIAGADGAIRPGSSS